MPEWLQTALIAVATAVVMFVTAQVGGAKKFMEAVWEKWTDGVRRGVAADGFQGMAKYQRLLEEFKRLGGGVDRVIMFVGRNGGGLPSPGSPYSVEAVWSWAADPANDAKIKARYDFPFPVEGDTHYCDMLGRLSKNQAVINTTKDMPPSLLRSLYDEEGVVQSALYLIVCRDDTIRYVSVASYTAPFDPGHLVRIELLVARIKSLLTAATRG